MFKSEQFYYSVVVDYDDADDNVSKQKDIQILRQFLSKALLSSNETEGKVVCLRVCFCNLIK